MVEGEGSACGGVGAKGDEANEVIRTPRDELGEGFFGRLEAGDFLEGALGGHVFVHHGVGDIEDHADGEGIGLALDVAVSGLWTRHCHDGGGQTKKQEGGREEAQSLAQGCAMGNAL